MSIHNHNLMHTVHGHLGIVDSIAIPKDYALTGGLNSADDRKKNTCKTTVAGQLGLKSSRPLSQLGPGSTRPGSTRPGIFSERSVTYMVNGLFCTCIIFQNLSFD